MTQLTIRGFDKELEREIRRLAAREKLSLDQAALRLLRKGAGLSEDSAAAADVVGSSLDGSSPRAAPPRASAMRSSTHSDRLVRGDDSRVSVPLA